MPAEDVADVVFRSGARLCMPLAALPVRIAGEDYSLAEPPESASGWVDDLAGLAGSLQDRLQAVPALPERAVIQVSMPTCWHACAVPRARACCWVVARPCGCCCTPATAALPRQAPAGAVGLSAPGQMLSGTCAADLAAGHPGAGRDHPGGVGQGQALHRCGQGPDGCRPAGSGACSARCGSAREGHHHSAGEPALPERRLHQGACALQPAPRARGALQKQPLLGGALRARGDLLAR